jgi:prophage tail gpP-like protein
MSFEIRINGTPFFLWKSATVQRSIDSNAGSFRFSNSSGAPLSDYPVKTGDFVEILIAGVRKIAGFVDEINGSQDKETHTIEISGRDNIADLIDSSIPDSAKVTEGPVSLKKLIENVISAIGASINVIVKVDDISDFTSQDLQAGGSGETCMAYLVSFARKRQVYLVPDGSGNLLIYRPDKSIKAVTPILHQVGGISNNVVTYSFRQSQANRFNKYLCRSQDNFGFDPFGDYSGDGTDRKNSVIDNYIRSSRYLEIQAENSMTEQECSERAAEESNIRRAFGTEYVASLPGVTQSNGELWDFGQFVTVIDEYVDITGNFLIKSVEYAIDISGGTRIQITCVPQDAYQVTAEPSKENKRTSKTGEGFQRTEPQKQGSIR